MAEDKYEVESEAVLERIPVEEFWKQILPRLKQENSLMGAITEMRKNQEELRAGVVLNKQQLETRGEVWVPLKGKRFRVASLTLLARFADDEKIVEFVNQIRTYVDDR